MHQVLLHRIRKHNNHQLHQLVVRHQQQHLVGKKISKKRKSDIIYQFLF
jgi:hypothetical protein